MFCDNILKGGDILVPMEAGYTCVSLLPTLSLYTFFASVPYDIGFD